MATPRADSIGVVTECIMMCLPGKSCLFTCAMSIGALAPMSRKTVCECLCSQRLLYCSTIRVRPSWRPESSLTASDDMHDDPHQPNRNRDDDRPVQMHYAAP